MIPCEDEISILAEIRAISDNGTANSRFDKKELGRVVSHYLEDDDDSTASSNESSNQNDMTSFLANNPEDPNFNQYWYSSETIKTLTDAILELLSNMKSTGRVAFLSTPSLYFALPEMERSKCQLFEYDSTWSNDAGYVHYDFNRPRCIASKLQGSFDMVVIDPPFITKDVWEMYALTAKLLLKNDPLGVPGHKGIVLGTTVSENSYLMKDLFDADPTIFKPVIPHLVYQYNVYINVEECNTLRMTNPDIQIDC